MPDALDEHRHRMADDPEFRADIERLLETLPPPELWSDRFVEAWGFGPRRRPD